MGTSFLLYISLIFCCLSTTNPRNVREKRNLHQPPPGLPTFVRRAVESKPTHNSAKYLFDRYQEEYGSTSLPLRAAVEKVPNAAESLRRLPLRDAVEKRLPPNEIEIYPNFDGNGISLISAQRAYSPAGVQSIPLRVLHQTPFRTSLRETQYFPLQKFHEAVGLNGRYRIDNDYQRLTSYRPGNYYPNNPFLSRPFASRFYDRFQNQQKKIVCFIDGQAVHRKDPLSFKFEDLNAGSCTHVVYRGASIDPKTYEIIPNDEDFEIIQGGYIALSQVKTRNPNLKILIQIWGDSAKFSSMASSPNTRSIFIKSLMQFLNKYQLDGADINWVFPKNNNQFASSAATSDWRDIAFKLERSVQIEDDKLNFKRLLEELRDAFVPMRYVLSISVAASVYNEEDSLDGPSLDGAVDFINLQAYDYYKVKYPIADHPAPLSPRPSDSVLDMFNNVEYSVNRWLSKGISSQKLILGIPFFGRSFTLQYSNDTSIGAHIIGPGRPGYYTDKPGFLSYYEICDKILNEGWKLQADAVGSPYISNGDQWIGFDDQDSVKRKVLFAISKNLGGVFAATADSDDFKGLCGDRWPLLNTINNVLTGKQPKSDDINSCGDRDGVFNNRKNCASYFACKRGVAYEIPCQTGMLYNPKEGRCAYIDTRLCKPDEDIFIEKHIGNIESLTRNERLRKDKSRVVCYFTSWSFYRQGEGKFVPENIDQSLCTHIVYAFASLDPKTLLMKEFDPWADVDNSLYQRVSSLQGTTVMLSLGGWTDSTDDKYSRLVSDSSSRRKFIIGVVDFLKKYGFRGLHLDWNYPVCWQSNCRKGPASDRNNFSKLVEELRQEFDKQTSNFVLAAAISGYKEILDVAYNIPTISKHLDFISVMTYDYHGSWERVTGHVSPLFGTPDDKYSQYNTDYTMNYIVGLGAPRDKLLIGIPFYGQSFQLQSEARHEIGAPTIGPGSAGEYTRQPGMLAYYEICEKIQSRSDRWASVKDRSSGPYAYHKNQWVGYDNIESAEEKAKYVSLNGYGGIVAWTIDLDDFNNVCCDGTFPLLKAINRGLGRITGPQISDCSKPPQPVTPPAPTLTTGVDSGATSSSSSTTSSWEETTKHTTLPWWSTAPTTTEKSTSQAWWVTTTQKPITTTTVRTTTSWWKPESTTGAAPTPAPGVGVTMPAVDHKPIKCTTGEYYADSMNCNAYYLCVNGEMKKQYCAGSLHWNKERGICDWPANAKCTPSKPPPHDIHDHEFTTPSATTYSTTAQPSWETTQHWQTRTTPAETTYSTTTQQPVTGSLEQPCEHGVYYPHGDCHNFYVCVNGQLVTQSCGPGLVWNTEQKRCDWKYSTDCGNRFFRRKIKDKLIQRIAYKPYTSCEAGSFAAYDGDCTQYLLCLWGKYEAFQCANGLEWNHDKKICDWPENAQCSRDGSTSSEAQGSTTSSPSYVPEWQPPSTQKPKPVTTPRPEVPREPLPPLSGYFKIVCYFTNWAWYRRGEGKYTPDDIEQDLCTHIVYGFAVLDYENLIIKPHDSWADFDNKFYERVVAYKSKGKKVSLALGGWNDSQGDKYSRLVNNPSARARFVKHSVEFLEKYGFDGLDLDWEYPKCWQVDCKKGPDSDKPAFAALTTELHQAFAPKGLLLSAAVSPSKIVVDAGYDVPTIGRNLDWVAVMTYDFHGQWDKQTGHVAPMYYHPEDEVSYYNSNFSINYWIEQGVPRRKIVMGMPMYGQSFTLENVANHDLNAKAPGPGQAGEYTRAAGFLAYYEICDKIRSEGWTVVQDPKRRMGPYAYKGNQWVSYDDKEMIQLKSEYIRKMDLGGGMIWALDLDDFRNRCGEGYHPLLTTIRKELAAPGSGVVADFPQEIPEKPEFIPPATVDQPQVPQDVPQSTTSSPLVDNSSGYKVVCYFTNWAWYRQGVGKYLPSDIDPNLCTHIVYGFAVLNGDQGIIKPHDDWADFDNKFYEKVTAFKAKGIKVLIAIGGWNDSAGDKYSKLVNNPSARRRFIAHVVEFIESNNFDGLDLDWEYPKCWQVDCNKGPHSDKPAFAEFVKELHEVFKPKGLLLSSAVSPSKRVIDAGYDVPSLSKYLDWIAVMCYDYHGQWDKVTGHVAPMYAHPEDADDTFNTNFTIHYWIEEGADPKKLVLGMPMYGQSFSLADNNNNGLNAPTYGGGEAGEETRARGFLSYYEICTNIRKRNWKVVKDDQFRMGPYAYSKDQWVSFDDIPMIEYKSNFIKKMGLGGGMIWALDLDDFKNICGCEEYPLLRTINRVLRNYRIPAPRCELGGITAQIPQQELTPTTHKTTLVPQWVTPTAGGRKECQGQLFVPHETNCQQYYLCNQGELQVQTCANGLYWNVDHCDWPENSACHPDGTTQAPEIGGGVGAVPVPEYTEKPFEPGTSPAAPIPPPSDSQYKVVCYFTNWAWYRQGEGKYVPSDIDDNLCTHITYGFAVLNPNTLTITPHDSWADIDNEFYNRVTAFKTKGVKVLIAIGGWNDSLGDKYSRLVNDPQARAKFIRNVIEFIEKWNFDGLDLDWEYPKCWQVDCAKGPDSDKPNFAQFVKELSTAFRPRGWLLSSAVSPSKMVIDAGYEVPILNDYFDWIAVMTYDFHGNWDKQTGHVAPLYYYPGDTYDYFNANFTLHYWIEKGAHPRKLIMGMPLYGQSFSLADASDHGLNAKSYGPGEAGEFTRAGGFLAFYEICERVKRRSWTVVRDPQGRMGPYAYNGNQWVSYDDIADIKRKSQLVKDLNLGGGMIWALDLDDFRNRCGCGKHPLLRMMNHELRNVRLESNLENCT